MRTSQYRHKNAHVLFNENAFSQFSDQLFEPPCASESTRTDSCSQGRGTVVFFEHEHKALVLKRYHRGGLLGRFVRNSYLFCGARRTRMWREFELLASMRALGLPVPKPVAVRCIRSSPLCYQGDIIIERIPNARTLADVLCHENLSEKTWESIGLVIRRFHEHAIEHADLNACNILLTASGQIFLIDFDKSAMHGQLNQSWCQANLTRLKRSLNKWKRRSQHFHFDSSHWQALERGYRDSPNMPVLNSSTADVSP